MSESPHAPPGAPVGGGTPGPPRWGEIDFDVALCLSDAWANTWSNFPLWLAVGAVGVLAGVLAAASVVGIVFVLPVLGWGATLFALRMHDGGASLGDLFAGFSRYGEALGRMLLCLVVLMLVGIAAQSVQLAGDYAEILALSVLGAFINLAVSIFVTPRLTFAYYYIVDQGLPAMEALQRAWQVTAPVKWKVAALVLIGGLIGIAVAVPGIAAILAGNAPAALGLLALIPAVVMITLMWVSAYRQLEEAEPAP